MRDIRPTCLLPGLPELSEVQAEYYSRKGEEGDKVFSNMASKQSK
jgi:hypothetical protein